jgi:outer membrane receptor protein involved in Fe transport
MGKIRLTCSAASVLAALLAGGVASAQTSPAAPAAVNDSSNEEIVVTAQKREQVLIDVPQSISVVSGEALEKQQAFNFQDYAKLIPGLQVNQSNPGEARIVLRGINTGGVAATVATYVDETPFGSSSGQVNAAILAGEIDTFDMARIEVLRGPQGTIYGASSLSGVVKFVSEAPRTDRFEAKARASIESTDGGDASYMGSAALNVPVSDSFAIRGSGFYRSYGGFIDSNGIAGSDVAKNINDSKSYGGRISALFKPSSKFSIRLTALLQNLDTNAGNVITADPATLLPLHGYSQSQYVPEYTNIAYRVYNGTADYDFGFATLTSATSYSTLNESLRDDYTVLYGTVLGLYSDATGPAADIGLVQQTNNERFTQEVRLASPKSDKFDWLVGGYYDWEKGAIIQRLDVYNHGTLTNFAGFPLLFDGATNSRYEEFAAFANGTYHVGEKFDLTFGGRYSHNDQNADQGGTGLIAPPALSSNSSEGVFTWSVAPQYKLGKNSNIYARVAKGFRPGGPNIVPPGAPTAIKTYNSDSLISYEVGWKAETANHKLAIDIAAFHIDWDDIQLFASINNYGVNANGGKAKSNGVEFTATMRPVHGLNVSVNGAFTDARLLEDTDPIVGGRKGDQLPFTPQIAVSLNGDYQWNVGGSTLAYVGGSVRLVGDQSGQFSPAEVALTGHQYRIPAYDVVDLHTGLDFGKFTLEAYVKNLGNARGITSIGGEGNVPFGAINTGVLRPRTIGLTVGARF